MNLKPWLWRTICTIACILWAIVMAAFVISAISGDYSWASAVFWMVFYTGLFYLGHWAGKRWRDGN